MSLAIRFALIGKKKQPVYRIVVVEKRSKRNGQYLDALGYYNKNVKVPEFNIDRKKYEEWIKKGAQPSVGLIKLLNPKK